MYFWAIGSLDLQHKVLFCEVVSVIAMRLIDSILLLLHSEVSLVLLEQRLSLSHSFTHAMIIV